MRSMTSTPVPCAAAGRWRGGRACKSNQAGEAPCPCIPPGASVKRQHAFDVARSSNKTQAAAAAAAALRLGNHHHPGRMAARGQQRRGRRLHKRATRLKVLALRLKGRHVDGAGVAPVLQHVPDVVPPLRLPAGGVGRTGCSELGVASAAARPGCRCAAGGPHASSPAFGQGRGVLAACMHCAAEGSRCMKAEPPQQQVACR